MILAGTGIGRKAGMAASAQAAARVAMDRLHRAGAKDADLVFLFVSGEEEEAQDAFPEAAAAARKICGSSRLVGCSGAGILSDECEIEGETAAVVLAIASNTLQAIPFYLDGLKGRDHAVGGEIGRLVKPVLDENPLIVLFPDTLSCDPDLLFDGIHEVAGPVPIVGGGAASGNGRTPRTWQVCDGEASSNALSGVIITGAIVSSIGVTQSCLPLGRALKITSSNGNAIHALDGLPAIQALARSFAGEGRALPADFSRIAPHLFVAFPAGPGREVRRGQYIVRSILGVDPDDGAIIVGRETHEGESIAFALRDPQGAREDLKAMIEETLPVAGQPDLGLYFNCCARGSGLYGLADIDTSYIRNAFGPVPLAGFFGFAEIAPLRGRARLHNYAGVMALISEVPSIPPHTSPPRSRSRKAEDSQESE